MKAVQIHAYKDENDFHPRDIPIPSAKTGETIVQVYYAGINPSDLGNSQGYFAEHTTLPRVIGRDFAGKVVDGDPTMLGKVVMGSGGDIGFTRDGSFAEYMAIPVAGVVEVPPGLDLSQAAAIGVPFLAALGCFDSFPQDLKGTSMLIIGGAGAVGSASTVIARRRGANVVRTIRNADEVSKLTPDLQIGKFLDLTKSDDIVGQSMELTDGKGFNFLINLVGGTTFEPSVRSLADYGKIACIASPGQPRVEFSLLEFYRKNHTLYGINTALETAVQSAAKLRRLFSEFEGAEQMLAALGDTQVVSFSDAGNVLKKALAKEYRKPVFQMTYTD